MSRHFPKTSLEYAMMQWFLQSAQRTHTVGVVALYAWSPVLKVWIQLLHYLQITTDFNFWSNPVLSNQPYSECSLISSFLWSNIWELNDVLCQESPPPKKIVLIRRWHGWKVSSIIWCLNIKIFSWSHSHPNQCDQIGRFITLWATF